VIHYISSKIVPTRK